MRYFPLVSKGALACAFLFACDGPSGVTAPAQSSDLSFRAERDRINSGFAFGDGRRIVFIGFTLEDVAGLCAGTGFNLSEVNHLIVIRPDGSLKEQQRGKNVNVVVFETSAFTCDLSVPHLTGSGRLTTGDNDLLLSRNRANASMISFTGRVTDEVGQSWHLVAFGHQVLSRASTLDNLLPLNTVINIKLTRIGG
jgi:hypothetical protein